MFHALRHTHASALIAAGLDVVKISRRLGHGSPAVTPNVYGHLFDNIDVAAANAIEIALTHRYRREERLANIEVVIGEFRCLSGANFA
jgi:integrase